jgi:hypothetical protein
LHLGVHLVYLNWALFNHSCFPNCVRVQEGRGVSIRALVPLAALVECSIKYIDVDTSGGRQARQAFPRGTLWVHVCLCALRG